MTSDRVALTTASSYFSGIEAFSGGTISNATCPRYTSGSVVRKACAAYYPGGRVPNGAVTPYVSLPGPRVSSRIMSGNVLSADH
jgi:hypothetical protein